MKEYAENPNLTRDDQTSEAEMDKMSRTRRVTYFLEHGKG